MNLPKLPHNLNCWLDELEALLDAGQPVPPLLLRRLIEDGRAVIKTGARRNDPYFREIDPVALREAYELAQRREFNTNGD